MPPALKVLVVDDSMLNRYSIEGVLKLQAGVEVVGRAKNGEEALQVALAARPDVITLDLEMPRIDGFTFLRILMSKQPTPVIVVSSYGNKETVFRALELGAVDFVARPEGPLQDQGYLQEVVDKVLLARHLRPNAIAVHRPPPPSSQFNGGSHARPAFESFEFIRPLTMKHLVVMAASTGGPTALIEILSRLPRRFPGGVVIAQHMPDKFTRTFAERLDKRGPLGVSEGKDGDLLFPEHAFVSPGGLVARIVPAPPGAAEFALSIAPPAGERHAPSADALMISAAKHAGTRVIGVVLTGMGDDGLEGAKAIRAAGGRVIAESPETSVVHGMPGSVIRAGAADRVMTLSDIASFLASLAS